MRYLVLSDVHANTEALEAVLSDARWDEVLFLGDAVNYGPNPREAVELLVDLPGLFLEGNHDRKVLDIDPDARVDEPSMKWTRWTRRQLSDEHLAFLRGLGGPTSLERDDPTFRLHHGDFEASGIPGFDGRLWPDANPSVFAALAERFPGSYLLHGHTHVQFEVDRAGMTFANPGSVGQPRLGRPKSCYAILEDGTITYHATAYDVERTCAAMDDLPLDRERISGWKEAYRSGRLPEWFDIRDFETLQEDAYRYRIFEVLSVRSLVSDLDRWPGRTRPAL